MDFPNLNICVPHMGFDEVATYRDMIEKYDNLWLDTTMVLTDYFSIKDKIPLNAYRSDRVMFGSDFPNIPYAWDREIKALQDAALDWEALANISFNTATGFFNIDHKG